MVGFIGFIDLCLSLGGMLSTEQRPPEHGRSLAGVLQACKVTPLFESSSMGTLQRVIAVPAKKFTHVNFAAAALLNDQAVLLSPCLSLLL